MFKYIFKLIIIIFILQGFSINATCKVELKNDKLFPITINDKWGYINESGKIIIKPKFNYALPFTEDRAFVVINEKYGVIDKTGDFIVKPKFSFILPFSEGLAAVHEEDAWGFIDKSGKWAIKLINGVIPGAFSEGLASIQTNDNTKLLKVGFIDKKGNVVIEPKFDIAQGSPEIFLFKEGLSAVNIDGHWGYINKKGEWTIKPKFQYAYSFSENLASVKLNNKWGFIDRSGRFIIRPKFDFAMNFSEGLVAVKYEDKISFINKVGDVIIKLSSDSYPEPFSESLSNFRDEAENVGFIDKNGVVIIKPQFANGNSFQNGLSKVSTHDNSWGYIDKKGNWIWKPTK